MRNVHYIEDRWVLEVTFDSIEDQKKSRAGYAWNGVDEAFSFVRHAVDTSGVMSWEIRQMVKWEKGSRTVTITSYTIDYLDTLQGWVTMFTIPVKMELKRTQSRVN